MSSEIRMAAIFRADIAIPIGKMLAQAGHAFLSAYIECNDETLKNSYIENGQTKIVLEAPNLETLFRIQKKAKDKGVPAVIIKDAGRTVFNEPTFTCLGLGPMDKTSYNNLTRGLDLVE